jgi:hypothetical protein
LSLIKKKKKKITKKIFLIREGKVCKFEGFINKGLSQIYHIDQNDFEQVLYFTAET